MKYYSQEIEKGKNALVFMRAEDKLVIGVIINNNGFIVGQILNPARPEPLENGELVAPHHKVNVEGKEYIAADRPPITVQEFIKTAHPDKCSDDMLRHLQHQVKAHPVYKEKPSRN